MCFSCDLHLGDSRLQYNEFKYNNIPSCDLHLGDSRLQLLLFQIVKIFSCDLHLGDSRLQLFKLDKPLQTVVICI